MFDAISFVYKLWLVGRQNYLQPFRFRQRHFNFVVRVDCGFIEFSEIPRHCVSFPTPKYLYNEKNQVGLNLFIFHSRFVRISAFFSVLGSLSTTKLASFAA